MGPNLMIRSNQTKKAYASTPQPFFLMEFTSIAHLMLAVWLITNVFLSTAVFCIKRWLLSLKDNEERFRWIQLIKLLYLRTIPNLRFWLGLFFLFYWVDFRCFITYNQYFRFVLVVKGTGRRWAKETKGDDWSIQIIFLYSQFHIYSIDSITYF